MQIVIDVPDNEIFIGWYTHNDGVNKYHNAKTLGEPNYIPLDKIRAEIEPKCDRINSLVSVLPYTAHREIQELLCEIMDLCKAESEDKE